MSDEFKIPEDQELSMPNDGKVDIHTELDEEVWEELTEFIDEHKSVRREGKKWYGEQIAKLALIAKRQHESSGMEEFLDSL